MLRSKSIWSLYAVVAVTFATPNFAWADEPAPPHGEAGPHHLIQGTHLATLLQFNADLPAVIPVIVTEPGIIAGLGIAFKYDGNGLPNPNTGMRTTDNVSFGTNLYVSYALLDRAPFVLHPEIAWFTTWAPGNPFDVNVLLPGIGFGFAPWAAPILIDAAWDLRFTFVKGLKPVIDTFSPALRIAFLLN